MIWGIVGSTGRCEPWRCREGAAGYERGTTDTAAGRTRCDAKTASFLRASLAPAALAAAAVEVEPSIF